MRRTVLFLLGGLLLAGMIHIAVIFLLPAFANRDAYTLAGGFGADGAFHLLAPSEPGSEPLPGLDPAMAHAICRFSLDERPLHIRAMLPETFWSLAVFDRRGLNVYSINDRSAEGAGGLDLILANASQVQALRQNLPTALQSSIVVELAADTGFVLLRVFVPDQTLNTAVRTALGKAECNAPLQ